MFCTYLLLNSKSISYGINLVFVQKVTFIVRKINKNCCHLSYSFYSNMHQTACRQGLRPKPHCGSLQRSPRPLAVFRGLLLKRGVWKKFVLCPRKQNEFKSRCLWMEKRLQLIDCQFVNQLTLLLNPDSMPVELCMIHWGRIVGCIAPVLLKRLTLKGAHSCPWMEFAHYWEVMGGFM